VADIYLRSVDGDDGDDGSTKALAKATLQAAITAAGSGGRDDGSTKALAKATLQAAITAAGSGGRVFMADDHSENVANGTEYVLSGGLEILSIDWTTDEISAGGTIHQSDGSSTLYIQGTGYIYGVQFTSNGQNSTFRIAEDHSKTHDLTFESCFFEVYIYSVMIGYTYSTDDTRVIFRNVEVSLTNATSATYSGVTPMCCEFTWIGGSITGSPSPIAFPIRSNLSGYLTHFKIVNVDLSIYGTGTSLLGAVSYIRTMDILFHRCRLGSGVSVFDSAPTIAGKKATLVECDHGTNFIRHAHQSFEGVVTEDTVRVRDNSDSAYSHKLVSSAYTKFYSPLRSFPVARYNATEGSAITVRVEVLTDGVTLTDGDFWIEVNYLGSASYPLGSIESSAKSNILATAANLSTSSEGWTTTDLSSPVKQYAEVTFTPQESGPIEIVACLAKASTTVYVDPDVEVS